MYPYLPFSCYTSISLGVTLYISLLLYPYLSLLLYLYLSLSLWVLLYHSRTGLLSLCNPFNAFLFGILTSLRYLFIPSFYLFSGTLFTTCLLSDCLTYYSFSLHYVPTPFTHLARDAVTLSFVYFYVAVVSISSALLYSVFHVCVHHFRFDTFCISTNTFLSLSLSLSLKSELSLAAAAVE